MAVGCWVDCPKRPLVQCVLERDIDEGAAKLVSWVDVRFAEVGLEVTVDRGGGPEPGWRVMSMGTVRPRSWVDGHRDVAGEYKARLQHRPKRKNRCPELVSGGIWWPWLIERCPHEVVDDALHS